MSDNTEETTGQPLTGANIRTINSLTKLNKSDIAAADVILVQDVSENTYKKASLQDVVDKMNPIQSVNLTTAEYNALSDAQKNNGTYYNITDSESTVQDELATLSATVATQAETITALQSELFFKNGDEITVQITTSGYVTNNGKTVSFAVFPLNKLVKNGTKFTFTKGTALSLRQNGNYVLGTTNVSANFDFSLLNSVNTYTRVGSGLCIDIIFNNNDSNTTNNDTIGIYFIGTFTVSNVS